MGSLHFYQGDFKSSAKEKKRSMLMKVLPLEGIKSLSRHHQLKRSCISSKATEDSWMTPLYSTDVNIKSFFNSTKELNWVPLPAHLHHLRSFWEYSFETKK